MLEYINAAHSDALSRLFFPSLNMEFTDDTYLTAFKIGGVTELTVGIANVFNQSIAINNSINAVTALIESKEQISNMDHIVKGISPVYIETHCVDISNQDAVIELIEAIAEQLYVKSNLSSKGIKRSELKIIIAGDVLVTTYLHKYKKHRNTDPNIFADWDIVGSIDKRLDRKMFIALQAIAYSPECVDVLSYGSHLNDRIQLVREPDALVVKTKSKYVLNLPILASIDIDQK